MDAWVTCPYNAAHKLPEHRLPYHLIKCQKTYNGPPLDTCPFNVTHLVTKGTLQDHFTKCEAYFHANREQLEIKYRNAST